MREGSNRPPSFLVFLAIAALVSFSGGCSRESGPGDVAPPTGSEITNPPDGASLNSPTINVRGRAEVGATVEIFVDDGYRGSAVSSPAAPAGSGLGRFTVEEIELGQEGRKEITGIVTDLYGNVAEEALRVEVLLDMTPPPVAFETVLDAEEESPGMWATGLPSVTVVGRTDTTSSGARVRHGINEYLPSATETFPGGPGEPDSVRFWVPVAAPHLTGANPDSLVSYFVEALDEAGNVASHPLSVLWTVDGRDTVLLWDDGTHALEAVTGQLGMRLAVAFQAPPWANYVVGIHYFIRNDNVDNPNDPTAPSTLPFIALVWEPNDQGLPGAPANSGLNSGNLYPEDAWLPLALPNPVNITAASEFPEKRFFVGLEWLHRNNPHVGVDTTFPTHAMGFRYDWALWERIEWGDVMIRAIVSDLPSLGEAARRAVVAPDEGEWLAR